MKTEQEQRIDPSIQNPKLLTSRLFEPYPQCQQANHPPEKCWSGPNAASNPKPFKQDDPADNRNEGREQGNLTHSGPISLLKNHLN